MQDGDTALFMACRSGFTAIVDILLHNGANVNIENTVIKLKVVELLVIKLLIIIQFGGTALHAASLGGYADIVERLIDFGASLDAPTEVQSHIHLSLHKLLHLHACMELFYFKPGW